MVPWRGQLGTQNAGMLKVVLPLCEGFDDAILHVPLQPTTAVHIVFCIICYAVITVPDSVAGYHALE